MLSTVQLDITDQSSCSNINMWQERVMAGVITAIPLPRNDSGRVTNCIHNQQGERYSLYSVPGKVDIWVR